MTTTPRRRSVLAGFAGIAGIAGVLGLGAACSGGRGSSGDGGSDGGGSDGGTSGGGSEGFPLSVANCDTEVTLESPPERVVLLDSAPVTILDGIGALGTVVARAGSFPGGYFDEDLRTRLEGIPALSEDIDATGHLQINQEVVIAQSPDLVLGLPDGITREGLQAAGAVALLPRTYCGGLAGRATFEALHEEIESYGSVFARTEEAAALVTSLRERIEAVRGAGTERDEAGRTGTARERTPLTAAALYATSGGGPLYAYGATSMVTAQLDALGARNVFEDTAERVFEVSAEPLLAADPDVLIVLHQGTAPDDEIIAETVGAARLDSLRAVEDAAVLPLLFNFSEPASPLVVDGLERIAQWLSERADAG